MASSDQDELLSILEAHGQQFLSSFTSSVVIGKRKSSETEKANKRKKRRMEEEVSEVLDEEEEWTGFSGNESKEDEDEEEDDEDDDEGSEVRSQNTHQPNVVVFAQPMSKESSSTKSATRAQQKAFMSSKVSKLTMDIANHDSHEARNKSDDEDELNNAQNDALLHRLLHTKLLSGSLDPDLDMTPAQRRKALAGRVMEAAGRAKLGKGETAVRAKERNKNAKHIRDGLLSKQKERKQKELEEAKNMGNYHPALKQLFANDDGASNTKRKRERGLGMGVGSFAGGVLRLSKSEIASVTGPRRPQGRKGGRRKP